MKNTIFAFVLVICNSGYAQLKTNYDSTSQEKNTWIDLLYADKKDAGLITDAYNSYYKTNPFVKNRHTQYYKRWLRSLNF